MYEYAGRLVRVVDGDTVDVQLDLGLHVLTATRLRLSGVNAPEVRTDAGKAARGWLAALMPPGTALLVRTEKDRTEKYGRWLARVWLAPADGEPVNDLLVKAGHAVAWDGAGARPPAQAPQSGP